MIKSIGAEHFDKDFSFDCQGITLTELYDIISIKDFEKFDDLYDNHNRKSRKIQDDTKRKIRISIKKAVCRKLDYHDWLQKRLAEWNVPVLTTNYDTNIEAKMKQFVIPSELYSKGFSDTYLFNVYYACKQIEAKDEAEYFKHFSVWHINGRINYLKSIRVGLSDYMNLLVHTKDLLHDKAKLYYVCKDQPKWGMTKDGATNQCYTFTWLNIFYNSSICINGLGLNQDESYLRWLLISRKKYIERTEQKDLKGWYVCHPTDLTDGKRLFLESVGLKVVELTENRKRYEELFEIKNNKI